MINAMKQGEKYSLGELSVILGVKDTRAREIIKTLLEDGSIDAIGVTKGKRYFRSNE